MKMFLLIDGWNGLFFKEKRKKSICSVRKYLNMPSIAKKIHFSISK